MATRIPAPDPAAPATPPPAQPTYTADEGMVISTIRIQQTRDAYVAIEHPADWSGDELSAAVSARKADIVSATRWWDAAATTEIIEAVMDANEPDDPSMEPVSLKPADVEAPRPVAIVAAFSGAVAPETPAVVEEPVEEPVA